MGLQSPGGARVAAAALCVAVVCAAAPAHASAGESEWWLHVAAGQTPAGPLLRVDGRWLNNFTDFLAAGAVLQERRDLDGAGDTAVLAHGRLIIDAVTWVPALSVAAGPAWDWRVGQLDGLWRLEASVAWRPARDWGLQSWVALESRLRSPEPAIWMIGLGHGWFSGAAGALDL